MIILVTGGRDYADAARVNRVLARACYPYVNSRELGGGITLFYGEATGADALALRYAKRRGWGTQPYPYDRGAPGKSGGPRRNAVMVKEAAQCLNEGQPVIAVAFPGGTGTADCVRRIRAAGLPLVEVTK